MLGYASSGAVKSSHALMKNGFRAGVLTSTLHIATLPWAAFALPPLPQDLNHSSGLSPVKAAFICQRDITGHLACSDPRGPLKEVGKKFGLSDGEAKTAEVSTLTVDCMNADKGGTAAASGALYGNCHQFLTNIHVILDAHGKEPAVCHVFNHGTPRVNQFVSISKDTFLRLTEAYEKREWFLDIAAVRLAKPVPGISCFPLDATSEPLKMGDPLMISSPYQLNMKKSIIGPVGVACHLQDRSYSTANSIGHTDCTVTDGTSGSMVLWRNRNGELLIKGLARGSSVGRAYKPYVRRKNEAQYVGLDLDVIDPLLRFERDGVRKERSGSAPKTSE